MAGGDKTHSYDDVREKMSPVVSTEPELAEALRRYVPHSAEEKKLVRKIDLFLMPILWIMYILNYVDRTNIGNAKIAGMAVDLDLDDNRYAWVLSVFFFGYLICEVPSNMILSRSKPSMFLPAIMLVWGALSALMSISKTYGVLLGFRFVLGCIESGFFPGVLYYLSCWYTKAELGKRFGIFYTAAVLSGAFGGILAGAITDHMHDAHGIAGWRWLFIVEGVATVGVAFVAFFVLLDYPGTSKRLTPEERKLAAIRIIHDGIATGGHSDKRLSHWQAFVAAVTDPRTYMFLILYMLDVGAGTISYFIPTISQTMYKDSTKAQYMTVPIYVVAAVCLNILAWSSDRTGDRRWHITGALGLGFACSVVCAAVQTSIVRYVMVCFVAAGIWSALPLILSWTSNTVSLPPEKRAIVLALVNAFGNFSSVYGSRIWPKDNSPAFHIGFGVTAGFLGCGMILAALIPVLCALFAWKGSQVEMELRDSSCTEEN
ncbi:phthalate transporter [Metarhizium robertsii ARSEF 23]|uniref:Phthalate transporter n=1 Tax=Metarhizium robertsii (strain ARSEF 23 / ATCC MYA-3075) TaxID=655844 RepID=E9EZH5_METRA|nr:phthalate transporter [Metarhizium robertsii ARSEF 23]EFY99366.2 phthalate transporter [Metarhizium robertsii ARSEF 23]